jgi:tRNA pseudouridine13 synthase
MLIHLVDKPEDFVGAFRLLPVKLQTLFVQAYQSYLFNHFLSARIKNGFSLNKAEVGDYVMNVERSGLSMLNTARIAYAENLSKTNESVKVGKMRVALPLIGIKQRFSQGAMGKIERQILEKESVKTEKFRVDAIPEASGRGGLRAVVAPIKGFKVHGVSTCTANQRERQANLSFMLLRGSYATVFLREIMKPRDPRKAGF